MRLFRWQQDDFEAEGLARLKDILQLSRPERTLVINEIPNARGSRYQIPKCLQLLPASSSKLATPVTLPPGRLWLSTNPIATGSAT